MSATMQSPDPPPAKSQSHVMEVHDEHGDPPPASPISPADDDLLTGGGAVDIEGDLANLTISSPKNPDGSECLQDASGKGMKPPWWMEEEGHGIPCGTSQMIEGAD